MSDRIELRPDRFAAGGEAIARHDDGRIVFVREALPGETVAVSITETKKDFARGDVVDVLAASPARVEPPCAARRAGCGGCGFQHLTIDAQRRAKVEIVADGLRRIARLADADVRLGPAVPAEGYRTTIRLTADGQGRAGYRHERSHDVVAPADCLIAHPTLSALIPMIELDPGVDLTLRVSASTGEIVAVWDGRQGDVRGLPSAAQVEAGASFTETISGTKLRVSARSFFQSGPAAAQLIVDQVRAAAPELATAELVVDAYAGVGMLAACATSPTAHVVAIETNRSAVSDAEYNLGSRRAEVVRREVGAWRHSGADPVDVVIADPARSGLGKPGVNALAAGEAPVLVLVSCDPASLARDTKLLAERGYRHDATTVIDVFPHTTHVESVTRFTR